MEDLYIKLFCSLMKDALWQCGTPEMKVVMLTLLMMAKHKTYELLWNGQKTKCEPGQMVTSIASITEKCGKGVSDKAVRYALNKLEKYGFLVKETSHAGTLITIVNWNKYQSKQDTYGHWQKQRCFFNYGLNYVDKVRCSICKEFMCDEDIDDIDEFYPFCPHCGVEMDLDNVERIDDLFE